MPNPLRVNKQWSLRINVFIHKDMPLHIRTLGSNFDQRNMIGKLCLYNARAFRNSTGIYEHTTASLHSDTLDLARVE